MRGARAIRNSHLASRVVILCHSASWADCPRLSQKTREISWTGCDPLWLLGNGSKADGQDIRARFIPIDALSGYSFFGTPAALPVFARSFRLDRTAARTTEFADLLHPPM